MRCTTYAASLLVLAAVLLGCRQPAAPPQNPPASPAPASASPHQPDTTAIDQSVSANLGDPTKLRETIAALKQAVNQRDAAAVAAMVSYPITVNPHTRNAIRIRTPQDFVASYDKIITPHIAEVIEKQKYEELFVNYQGAMFGSGEVWIAGICKDKKCEQTDIRIKTIQNTSGNPK
jgi:hypothetical protein